MQMTTRETWESVRVRRSRSFCTSSSRPLWCIGMNIHGSFKSKVYSILQYLNPFWLAGIKASIGVSWRTTLVKSWERCSTQIMSSPGSAFPSSRFDSWKCAQMRDWCAGVCRRTTESICRWSRSCWRRSVPFCPAVCVCCCCSGDSCMRGSTPSLKCFDSEIDSSTKIGGTPLASLATIELGTRWFTNGSMPMSFGMWIQ